MRFTSTFSALLVTVLATASSVAAGTISQKVVFSATGVSDVTAKPDGCNTIVPDGVSQIACVKHVFTDGFTMSVRGIPNTAELFCAISGTSGTCGPNNVEATVDLTGGTGTAPAATDPAGSPKSAFSAADISSAAITSSGSGAAQAGSAAKSSSAKKAKSTAKATGAKSAKKAKSTGAAKAKATISQKVTFTASNTTTTAKPDGCASVTANGVKQTACVKHVFTDGFTMSVRGIPNTAELFCAISGTTGTCGPDAVEATVDLTGGTGTAPAATDPAGSPKSAFSAADISSAPITRRHARDFLRL